MKLMTSDDIAELTGFSVRHVKEKLIFRKDFPSHFNLGRNGRRWETADIEKWIRAQRSEA